MWTWALKRDLTLSSSHKEVLRLGRVVKNDILNAEHVSSATSLTTTHSPAGLNPESKYQRELFLKSLFKCVYIELLRSVQVQRSNKWFCFVGTLMIQTQTHPQRFQVQFRFKIDSRNAKQVTIRLPRKEISKTPLKLFRLKSCQKYFEINFKKVVGKKD